MPVSLEKKGWSIEEFRKIYGFGRNKAYEVINMPGFPACRFNRKIIILAERVPEFMMNIASPK